jgi:hypothetical protein
MMCSVGSPMLDTPCLLKELESCSRLCERDLLRRALFNALMIGFMFLVAAGLFVVELSAPTSLPILGAAVVLIMVAGAINRFG